MFKDLKKNKNGVVYITVLMITIVMMVLTLSIISLNVSQVTSSEKEVKRIKAETLAQGLVAYGFSKAQVEYPSTYSNSYNMDGNYYASTYFMPALPYQPENMIVSISY